MKKISLFATFVLISFSSWAQEAVVPSVVDDVISQYINPEGKMIVAQDITGATILLTPKSLTTEFLETTYPGNGNCHSNTGVFVGQSMSMTPALFIDGKSSDLNGWNANQSGALNGVTPDGKRTCGWMAPSGSQMTGVPIYCDFGEDGKIGNPIRLPFPQTDFFGDKPQFVNAVWISDDGKTIIGQVMDSTGLYTYPIVFTQNGETWDYVLPSEPMFNPDHIQIPTWPVFNMNPPVITNYMTEDNRQRWTEDLAKYEEEGIGSNPWDHLFDYISEEKYSEYEADMAHYLEKRQEYYDKIDAYWTTMGEISKGSNFALGAMALNPEGTILATSLSVSNQTGMTDMAEGYQLVVFDLANDKIRIIDSKYDWLIPHQVLEDGSVIVKDISLETDYVLLPDAEEVITLVEFLEEKEPSWAMWLKENLTFQINTGAGVEDIVMTGTVSFSRDLSTMAGGYNGFDGMFTYIFNNGNTSIESIDADLNQGTVVYDLRGVKVMDTDKSQDIHNLPRGIYIVNGKKVVL